MTFAEAYDMIDRFLRNNLDDDAYAERSNALNVVSQVPEHLVLVPVAPLIALRNGRQCDEDGVEIAVSRQAVDELLAKVGQQ